MFVAIEKFIPNLMAGYQAYANNNCFVLDEGGAKKRLPNGWHNFDEVMMTALGPIGIKKDSGFIYLDPNINEERGI